MRLSDPTVPKLAGVLGLTLACLATSPRPAAASPAQDDHATAVAALEDIEAAQRTIVSAEDSFATDPAAYRDADQRAINALVGARDPAFMQAAGTPGDDAGAIGHIQRLLDRTDTPPWVAPLRGAEANLRAAVGRLQEAKAARELMAHEIAGSAALENILAATGRPTQSGVFGGLQGALATTVLGVPAGANRVDACDPPQSGPAFGTHDGWLAFVSLPLRSGPYALPIPLAVTEVEEQGAVVVLKTPAAARVAELCRKSAGGQPGPADSAVRSAAGDAFAGFNQPHGTTSAPKSESSPTAGQTDDAGANFNQPPKPAAGQTSAVSGHVPALYTQAQARAGATIYRSSCVSCHGANLQGVAAPGVAGNEFLTTAEHNDWTLEVIRTLVFGNMPLNNPRSLTSKQYADVMAFLLASNCFPAGSEPFPEADQPSFAKIQLRPLPSRPPDATASGVCPVK